MADSKFFGVPFATSGDKMAIPEETQPSGAVSFQQGFGPDYERDPETDPLAKRVPRDETNELYYQVTNALKFLQLYGTPEWYAEDDLGNTVTYPLTARVRHPQGGIMRTWVSIVSNNTAEPGTDATKWALDEAFSISGLEASLAEMLAGTSGDRLATPRRVASSVQRGAWNYAVAGGTANALTATLVPALAEYSPGVLARVRITNANTGAATLNLNGIGARAIKTLAGQDLTEGDLVPGAIMEFAYDQGTNTFVATNLAKGVGALGIGAVRTFTANGTWTRPAGCRAIMVEVLGAGGAGGGASNPGVGLKRVGGGGAAGGYARKLILSPPASQAVAVGAAGAGTNGSGNSGGTSSFGTVQATGGAGAPLENPTAQPDGSVSTTGGVGSGGDINANGAPGGRGVALSANAWGGIGGSSPFGGGGYGSGTSGAQGGNASGYGAGGGGAVATDTATVNAPGGNGAPGLVIVTEYF